MHTWKMGAIRGSPAVTAIEGNSAVTLIRCSSTDTIMKKNVSKFTAIQRCSTVAVMRVTVIRDHSEFPATRAYVTINLIRDSSTDSAICDQRYLHSSCDYRLLNSR